jgi:hypothetical protein
MTPNCVAVTQLFQKQSSQTQLFYYKTKSVSAKFRNGPMDKIYLTRCKAVKLHESLRKIQQKLINYKK